MPFSFVEQRLPENVTVHALSRRMKHVRQSPFEGTCAATALKMVLKYYRQKVPSAQKIYEEIRADPVYASGKTHTEGLTGQDLVAYARHNGHKAWSGVDGTLELLKRETNTRDTPVIVFFDKSEGPTHAIVVTSVDDTHVHYHDPDAIFSIQSKMRIGEFMSRWFDNRYHYIIVKNK